MPSLSARRAWIEISAKPTWDEGGSVALRKESVDRNVSTGVAEYVGGVALRKESVDRNWCISRSLRTRTVALRKESVDRNENSVKTGSFHLLSLSARRAWIEIK